MDAYEEQDVQWTYNTSTVLWGFSDVPYRPYFLFNTNIPKNAMIYSATFQVYNNIEETDDIISSSQLAFSRTLGLTNLETQPGDIAALMSPDGAKGNWAVGWYDFDATETVQHFVTMPGYESGHKLCLALWPVGGWIDRYFTLNAYEGTPANAAKLQITYGIYVHSKEDTISISDSVQAVITGGPTIITDDISVSDSIQANIPVSVCIAESVSMVDAKTGKMDLTMTESYTVDLSDAVTTRLNNAIIHAVSDSVLVLEWKQYLLKRYESVTDNLSIEDQLATAAAMKAELVDALAIAGISRISRYGWLISDNVAAFDGFTTLQAFIYHKHDYASLADKDWNGVPHDFISIVDTGKFSLKMPATLADAATMKDYTYLSYPQYITVYSRGREIKVQRAKLSFIVGAETDFLDFKTRVKVCEGDSVEAYINGKLKFRGTAKQVSFTRSKYNETTYDVSCEDLTTVLKNRVVNQAYINYPICTMVIDLVEKYTDLKVDVEVI
jgi:hypothetical protein